MKKCGHLGEENHVPPELGVLEAVPAQVGAAQDGGDPGGRPPPPVDRGRQRAGASWACAPRGGARDRPQRGSRNRRLGAPGPDSRFSSECGGCRHASPSPSRLMLEMRAGLDG